MFLSKELCLILVELCMIVVCKDENDYLNKISSYASYVRTGGSEIVDKLSSYYDEYTQKQSIPDTDTGYDQVPESRTDDKDSCEKKLRECRALNNDISDESLSRRIVNMLLSRTDMREEGSLLCGRIELEVTPLELEALKNFGLGISTLREVAPVLNNAIKTVDFDGVNESSLGINSPTILILNFIVGNKDVIITVFIVSYLFWLLSNVRCNFWIIWSIGIQVIFIVIFFVTWSDLLREGNIEQVPIQCQPHKMRWTDKIMALVSSPEDCEKHYGAKMASTPLEITAHLVFIRTINRVTWGTIALGDKMGSTFLKCLTDHLPRMGSWILRTANELSLTAILSSVLSLFCCYYYYSRRSNDSVSRRPTNSNIKRWMTMFMENPFNTSERVKTNETNDIIVVKKNSGSRNPDNGKYTVEVTDDNKKRISDKRWCKNEEDVTVNSQEVSGLKVVRKIVYIRRKRKVQGRGSAKAEFDGE